MAGAGRKHGHFLLPTHPISISSLAAACWFSLSQLLLRLSLSPFSPSLTQMKMLPGFDFLPHVSEGVIPLLRAMESLQTERCSAP